MFGTESTLGLDERLHVAMSRYDDDSATIHPKRADEEGSEEMKHHGSTDTAEGTDEKYERSPQLWNNLHRGVLLLLGNRRVS